MQFIWALIALSFLIIIHELGHFTVAKLAGIKVHEFALFMGPKIFSFQKGETTYSLRAVPLGGFVRMEGEEQASDDERAFNKKSIPVRMAVIAAGPIMNLIAAVVIAYILFSINGFVTTQVGDIKRDSLAVKSDIRKGDTIVSYNNKRVFDQMDIEILPYTLGEQRVNVGLLRDGQEITRTVTPERYGYKIGFIPYDAESFEGKDSNLIKELSKDYPGDQVGLKVNDRIVALEGKPVKNRKEINDYLTANKEKPVVVTVERDKVKKDFKLTPKKERLSEIEALGVTFTSKRGTPGEIFNHTIGFAVSNTRSVYYSFLWLVTGKVSFGQMMGPVGIVSTMGKVVEQRELIIDKILGLLSFTAFLSINLGVFNLIPFPALDGSKIFILLIEGVRRKAIPPEKEAAITMVGFVLLITLMIFATYNDITRIIFGGAVR